MKAIFFILFFSLIAAAILDDIPVQRELLDNLPILYDFIVVGAGAAGSLVASKYALYYYCAPHTKIALAWQRTTPIGKFLSLRVVGKGKELLEEQIGLPQRPERIPKVLLFFFVSPNRIRRDRCSGSHRLD